MKILQFIFFIKLLMIYTCCCEEDPCDGETWTLTIYYNIFKEKPNAVDVIKSKMVSQGKVQLELFTISDEINVDDYIYDDPRTVTLFHKISNSTNINKLYRQNHIVIYNSEKEITYNKCSLKKYPCEISKGPTQYINKHLASSKSVNECKDNYKNTHQNIRDCIQKESTYDDVTLVSANVLNFSKLYDLIHMLFKNKLLHSIHDNKFEVCPLATIYVYGIRPDDLHLMKHSSRSVNIKSLDYSTYEVMKHDPNTIAVLANKPFDILGTINVPTIFCEDPGHIDDAAFINSFWWMPTEKTMFAIYQFLQENYWKRVAIISDDSTVSKNFEQKITEMFARDEFIYVSRTCDVANCNYGQILTPIISVQAKVIIANIGYDQISEFANQVKSWTHIVWIFRSPTAARLANEKGIQNVFEIHLGDTMNRFMKVKNVIVEYVRSNQNIKPPRNIAESRHLAEIFKNKLHKHTEISASVLRYRNGHTFKIAQMKILHSNAVENYITHNYLDDLSTGLNNCTIKSNVFFKPCYDVEYMFFMLVLSVFILMVLVIAYVFQSADVSYTRFSD